MPPTQRQRPPRPAVAAAAAAPAPETPEANRDVVAAVSYRTDGTPDQTPGFVVVGQDGPA